MLTLDVREPESYEALSFSDIINEVEVLGKEGICIGGISYTVHTYINVYIRAIKTETNIGQHMEYEIIITKYKSNTNL